MKCKSMSHKIIYFKCFIYLHYFKLEKHVIVVINVLSWLSSSFDHARFVHPRDLILLAVIFKVDFHQHQSVVSWMDRLTVDGNKYTTWLNQSSAMRSRIGDDRPRTEPVPMYPSPSMRCPKDLHFVRWRIHQKIKQQYSLHIVITY